MLFAVDGAAGLRFVTSPVDVEVTEGEDASFECTLSTSCASSVTISWYKDDELIPADDTDFQQSFDGRTARLEITGTYIDDAAVYRCNATTDSGSQANTTGTLVVNGEIRGVFYIYIYICRRYRRPPLKIVSSAKQDSSYLLRRLWPGCIRRKTTSRRQFIRAQLRALRYCTRA